MVMCGRSEKYPNLEIHRPCGPSPVPELHPRVSSLEIAVLKSAKKKKYSCSIVVAR